MPEPYFDALIVGAGFNGINILHQLRKRGFNVKLYEFGSDLGGTWFWNRYPGARVDSETPIYQLSCEKEIWEDFEWWERFPGREELMRYFHHLDKVLNLSKDIVYNTFVKSATFDSNKNLWLVKTDTGLSTWARHLFLCLGFASKRYTPSFPGLEKFKGICHHSNLWPEDSVDLKDKRVAVIGTGASGVQIIQEIAPVVKHLTVYQRTPNLALPMQQVFRGVDKGQKWQFPSKDQYEGILQRIRNTFGALVIDIDFSKKSFHDCTPQERRALYEYMWDYGGFAYWIGTYKELFFNEEANAEEYAFWAEKQRARIHDPVKRDILAPLKAPHPFGCKRPCLESTYYECFNQSNVDIIDVKASPILEITEQGVKTAKEGVIPVDVLILATGFDSVTGGQLNIKITNGEGYTLQEHWADGTKSFLGLSTAGFPNMYWTYGPQAPTAFSNGPTCGEIQGNWVVELLEKMRTDGTTRVVATKDAENTWTNEVRHVWKNSLFPQANSWYQGSNIPGKKVEALNYFCGIPFYIQQLENCKKDDYAGFTIV